MMMMTQDLVRKDSLVVQSKTLRDKKFSVIGASRLCVFCP